jgi:hypothetical protein
VSRLKSLSIPFVQGQNDAIAAEVLPDGVLQTLENGRFNKAGELALRAGWRPVDMSSMPSDGTVTARDLYSYGESLVALHVDSLGDSFLAAYANPTSTQPWYVGANRLSPARDVRRAGGSPNADNRVDRASAALTADGVYGAVLYQPPTTSGSVRIFRVATNETLLFASAAAATTPSKLVGLGTQIGLVANTGSALTLAIANPSTGSPSFGTPITLVTTTATAFDAVTAVSATPDALYVAWVEGGDVLFGAFSITTGAQLGATKTVDSGGGESYVAVASNDSRVSVAYQATVAKTVQLLTFDAASPYANDAGPTAVLTSACVPAWLSAGMDSASTTYVQAQDDAATTAAAYRVFFATRSSNHAVSSFRSRYGHMLAGGTVVLGPSPSLVSVTTSYDFGVVQLGAGLTAQPWFVVHGEGNDVGDGVAVDEPPYAPAQSASGTVITLGRNTQRQPVVRVWRYAPTERRQGVVANGDLYVAGGVVGRWSGVVSTDSGILAPVFFSLTPSNGAGNLTSLGVYRYRAILRWTDSRGADFQGQVSTESAVTLGAADDTVTLVVYLPPSLTRSSDLVVAPRLELYRTDAGGELFYLVHIEDDLSSSNDTVTIVDLSGDASILDEARLYTEGDAGATSGRLSTAIPRPASFLAATRDRLALGGPDPEYQLSQLTLASEPVLFADPGVDGPGALVYFDQADADVSGVAALDDTVIVGTPRSLFVTSGDGPNFAGVGGEFTSPARLPSHVGVYDWRSLLSAADGLWFLGDLDKLFLLPRGEGTPAFIGEAVQDRLAGGVVGAGLDSTAHVLGWAVAGASPLVVVRDITTGAWSVDPLPFTPASLVGHAGRFWAVASTGVVWEQPVASYGDGAAGATAVVLRATTGDVQVFGLAGWGRTAVVELEGVFQAAASLLVEVSYDQGLSWTSLGAHALTGLAVGEVWQRQWFPANQRGGKFRLRVTMTPTVTTTEGCRLTGFTLYYTTQRGATRLASAKRR